MFFLLLRNTVLIYVLLLFSFFLNPPPQTWLVAEAVAGMFLTMAGITLCVISSTDDKVLGKHEDEFKTNNPVT